MTAAGTEFMDGALCVQFDPDVFAGDRPDLTASAQRICSQCPVQPECGEYGRRRELDGVWGGLLLSHGQPVRRQSKRVLVECAAAGCRKTFVPPLWAKRFCSPACQMTESRARSKRKAAVAS